MSFNVTVAAGFNAVVASSAPITIADNAKANPYPSTVTVTNVNGSVNRVTVTLTGLTHPFPDDIDVLLVGPNGQGVVLMSDAGAGGSAQTALNAAWLIFDDGATANLPDAAPIIPFNNYKPTNYEIKSDEFASPAPQGTYATSLTAAFQGINPNGTWSLYVQDDSPPDAGTLQGWILNIALNEVGPTLTGLVDTSTNEDSFVTIPFTVGSATLDTVAFVTSASNSNLVSSIKVGGSGADRILQIGLVPDASGTSQITVAATDATGTRTRQLLLTVNAVNDAPVFAALPDIRITGPTTVTLNVTDVDTPLNLLTFIPSTASVGLINDVQFTVNGSTVTARIIPEPNGSGTDRLTITVSDGSSSVSQSFNVTVVPPGPPVLDPIPDATTPANTPVVIALKVTDSDTLIENLTFTPSETDSLLADAQFAITSSNTVAMTLTPIAGKTGGTRVTVSVSDGSSASSQSFNLTVVSAAPVLAPIPTQTTPQNVSVIVPLTVTDADTPLSQLTFIPSTSDSDLIKDVTIITVGPNVTATITPVTNKSGAATVTITVSDGSSSSSQTFTVNVTRVCQPPVIGAIAAQTGAPGTTISVVIPVTDPDDPLTNLVFTAQTTGTGVIDATFPVTGNTVTGKFTIAANASGSEQITVTAADGCSSTKQTFTLTFGGNQGTPASLSAARNGTNFVLSVTGTVGASYVIESTGDFKTWSVVDTITIPAGGVAQVTVPATGKAKFFRVRTGAGALAAQKTALFVVANTTLVAGDAAVSNRLATLGYTVTTKAAPSSTIADANGKTLIVVSSTITSGDVGAKFTTSNVPLVHWEQAIQDDLFATGNAQVGAGDAQGGFDRNTTAADQTQLNILTTNHPLAAGLTPGLHTVASTPTTFSWGVPGGDVIKIATIATNAAEVAVYGYDAGATLIVTNRTVTPATITTNKAAARRVFLFMQDPGLSVVAADGFALFDAAINWAASKDVTSPTDAIVIVNGQDDGDGTVSTGTPPTSTPAAESVEHVIDNFGQKYLNFLDLNSGFVVTPSLGRTLVNTLRLWTANDSEPRDPSSYKLEGAVNGPNGPFTLISEGGLALPTGRNTGGSVALTGSNYQDVSFSNTTPYTSYRLTFPTLKQTNAAAANSMQIGEVDFIGVSQ
jgi:subtilisin-like proprotein convertase family protein